MAKKNKKGICERAKWFKFVKCILRIFIKKPKYVFLGENFCDRALILSNHVGAKGPVAFEVYHDKPFRFWGTYEMNSGIKEVYKYLSQIYLYKKKHFSKFFAKVIGFIICPFLWLYYRGLKLISTYSDYRLKSTIEESIKTINQGGSIVIFPEDSSNGYYDRLTEFFSGFALLANQCLKQGIDLPVYVTYFKKKPRAFIVDKPFMWSEMVKSGLDKKQIAKLLLNRCNSLGKMDLSNYL